MRRKVILLANPPHNPDNEDMKVNFLSLASSHSCLDSSYSRLRDEGKLPANRLSPGLTACDGKGKDDER